jgi:acyl carrier protein
MRPDIRLPPARLRPGPSIDAPAPGGSPGPRPARLAAPNGGKMTEASSDNAKLMDEIIEVIASEGMIDREKITPDATIESLDLKSVDIVMILTALEEKFNVYIPMDGPLQEAKDVKSLIEALADHIRKEREKQ